LATHRSAIKRNRQNTKRKLVNQARNSRIKSLTKDVLTAVGSGDEKEAKEALNRAIPVIQRSASRGTIHRNAAFRKVSRLSKRVNSMVSKD
jgi:small subunit ribosomal protein S20